MTYDPIDYLGLSCPYGGDFYICQDSLLQFVGCCSINPCPGIGGEEEGVCDQSALYPASFNSQQYDKIPKQDCSLLTKPAQWYTCTDGPQFLGCCTINPCDNKGVCPQDDVAVAILTNNPASASVFLTTPSTTSVTSTTSTPTSSALTTTSLSTSHSTSTTIVATSTPSPGTASANKGSSHASIGGIVGGVVGGLLVLGLIAFAFFRHRRRRRALDTTRPEEDAMTALQSPWSPYHDSFRNSSIAPPPTVSPLSSTSTHHRSISASLSSIIGFKRSSIAKRRSTQLYTNYEANAADGALTSPVELEGRSPSSAPVYEVLGSVPDAETKDAAR